MNISPALRTLQCVLAALFLSLLTACGNKDDAVLQTQIEALSQKTDGGKNDPIAAKDLIAAFYKARDYKPVWTEKKREEMRAIVNNADTHGLEPEDYHATLLNRTVGTSPEEKARAEILYTDALARLAYHLRFGKVDPHEIYADWNYRRSLSDLDAPAALEALVSASDLTQAVNDFAPQMPEYAAFRSALAQQLVVQKEVGGSGVAMVIDKLKVNLERIRWVAHALPKEYILVDVAGYNAALIRDGKAVWSSKVVVGKPYRETPVFRTEMTQVILNPTWTVPPTILKEDILAKLPNDPGIIARKGLRVYDEKGNEVEAGEYREGMRLTQPPGADNALGRYKFDMPNEHTVYLHDTPSREKFSLDARAFSSGCIRLEKPRELAVLLLGEQLNMSAQQVDEVIASNSTKAYELKQKIPVLILYFTAEAHDNVVEFRHDVYGRDAKLVAALREAFKVNGRMS